MYDIQMGLAEVFFRFVANFWNWEWLWFRHNLFFLQLNGTPSLEPLENDSDLDIDFVDPVNYDQEVFNTKDRIPLFPHESKGKGSSTRKQNASIKVQSPIIKW